MNTTSAQAVTEYEQHQLDMASRCPLRRLLVKFSYIAWLFLTTISANADDHKRERREHHNYIIERQQAGVVRGVPTSRLIIGKREIDIYPNGLMFEKDNVVGVRAGSR